MEDNEIATLNHCSQDISSKVLVSANVLQRLQYRKILSIEEKQSIKVGGKDKLQSNNKKLMGRDHGLSIDAPVRHGI